MGFRDTWHRALVYFGLAEDPGYDYDDPDAEYYEPETASEDLPELPGRRRRRGGRVRRLERRGGTREEEAVAAPAARDEIDDIFGDDEPARPRSRVLRPVSNGGADVQVHLVTPRNFNDAQEVADKFKRSVPVILNLQTSGPDLSKRLIDFASGLTYALDGGMQKIAEKTFLLTPRNVEVSAEQQAQLMERGFFNQS